MIKNIKISIPDINIVLIKYIFKIDRIYKAKAITGMI